MGAERDSNGRFKPGYSGNPDGRIKGDAEVRKILKEHSAYAARRLVELLEDENSRVVFLDVQEILNRTEGKPRESVQMDISGGFDVRAQIRDVLLERMMQERETVGQDDGCGAVEAFRESAKTQSGSPSASSPLFSLHVLHRMTSITPP